MTYARNITPRYFRKALITELYRTTYISTSTPPKEETKK